MSTDTAPRPHYVVLNLRKLFYENVSLQEELNKYHQQGYIISTPVQDGGSTDALIILELAAGNDMGFTSMFDQPISDEDEFETLQLTPKGRAAIEVDPDPTQPLPEPSHDWQTVYDEDFTPKYQICVGCSATRVVPDEITAQFAVLEAQPDQSNPTV